MTNRDLRLLSSVIENIEERVPEFLAEANVERERNIAHPLDDKIVNKLKPKFPLELYLGIVNEIRKTKNTRFLTVFPLYKSIYNRYNYI